MNFPLSNVTWRPSYRVIPSRFPPIDLFEGVNSHTDDWDLLNELEGETSARLREEMGAIHLVRDGDRRYGPGWTPVMAAFCHFPASGSRFSDGTFGAYYCALTEATAIAETLYHAERFMGESNEPPMMLQQRVYLSDLMGQLIDLRGHRDAEPYSPRQLVCRASPGQKRLGAAGRWHRLPQRSRPRWRVRRSAKTPGTLRHAARPSSRL